MATSKTAVRAPTANPYIVCRMLLESVCGSRVARRWS